MQSYAQIGVMEEGEAEEEDDHPEPRDSRLHRQPALRLLHQASPAAEPSVSEAQVALIKKLHNNCGHPPVDRFLRTLKAAGALPRVLKYVRDRFHFHCQDCESRRGPIPRRKAQCPRLFRPNRVVSVDIFYVRFQQASIPVPTWSVRARTITCCNDSRALTAAAAKNRWLVKGGYTPVQLVFGELPRWSAARSPSRSLVNGKRSPGGVSMGMPILIQARW